MSQPSHPPVPGTDTSASSRRDVTVCASAAIPAVVPAEADVSIKTAGVPGRHGSAGALLSLAFQRLGLAHSVLAPKVAACYLRSRCRDLRRCGGSGQSADGWVEW